MHSFMGTSLTSLFILVQVEYRISSLKKRGSLEVMCGTQGLSNVQLFVTSSTVAARLHCPLGFSRQEYWSGLPCPPPGDLPNPGFKPRSLALQADSLLSEPQGSPLEGIKRKIESPASFISYTLHPSSYVMKDNQNRLDSFSQNIFFK